MKYALLLLLAACGDGSHAALPDAGQPTRIDVGLMRPSALHDVDILFVIDDGPASILDKQTNLKANFPAFINALQTAPGGLPNLHLGVVTTDIGTASQLDAPAAQNGGCMGTGKNGDLQTFQAIQLNGKFISDISDGMGNRVTNYSGTLADTFSAIASAGAAGCGWEQPLEAMHRALDQNPTNAGFSRPNAGLAIITFTDEDDHSALHASVFDTDTSVLGPFDDFRSYAFGVTCQDGGDSSDAMATPGIKHGCNSNESSQYFVHVADEAAFLRSLKGEPRDILYAAIAGAREPVDVELHAPPMGTTQVPGIRPSCTYVDSSGSTEDADPPVRLAALADQMARGDVETICQQDLSASLEAIGRSIKNLMGDPCLTRDITIPPDCSVTDDATGAPLSFRIDVDAAACPDGQHLKFSVTDAPPDTWARVRCTPP